jgi:hypothetical protein
VAASSGRTRRVASRLLALSIALAVAGVDGSAHAQGFFDFLRGLFGGYRPPPQQQIGPSLLPERSPGEVSRKGDGTYAAYCVRLCDGRYFPLPAHAGAPSSSPQELCSAMCPATKTEVYTGSGIDQAISARGKPYTSLPNAFAYRERLANDCSCTGSGATGLAKIDIQSDPTLRPGDTVVTKEGTAAFKGDSRPPHLSSEFVPVRPQRQVSSGARRPVSEKRTPQEGRAIGAPRELPDSAKGQEFGLAPGKLRRVGPAN